MSRVVYMYTHVVRSVQLYIHVLPLYVLQYIHTVHVCTYVPCIVHVHVCTRYMYSLEVYIPCRYTVHNCAQLHVRAYLMYRCAFMVYSIYCTYMYHNAYSMHTVVHEASHVYHMYTACTHTIIHVVPVYAWVYEM